MSFKKGYTPWNKGIPHSTDTKIKISNALTGRKFSLETRKKISISANQRPPMSNDTKRKLRESHKGKKLSEETKRKIGNSHRGEKNHNWNGGQIRDRGYVYILKRNHPLSNKNGYVKRAYLVWEDYWRELFPKRYRQHHIDKTRDNDEITNLSMVTTSFHSRTHITRRFKG